MVRIWNKLGIFSPNGIATADKQTINLFWIFLSSASIPCVSLKRNVNFFLVVFKQTVIGKVWSTEIEVIHLSFQKQYIYEASSFRAFRVWTCPIYPSNWVSIQRDLLCQLGSYLWVLLCCAYTLLSWSCSESCADDLHWKATFNSRFLNEACHLYNFGIKLHSGSMWARRSVKLPFISSNRSKRRVRIKGSKAWDLLFSMPIEGCLHVQCTKGHLVVTEIAD